MPSRNDEKLMLDQADADAVVGHDEPHLATGSADVNVVLRGGPPSLSLRERMRFVRSTDDKLKLFQGNRYDHFEPTGELERHLGRDLHVFVWTGSTYVAE